jgi:hypothetical protein
VVDHPYGRAEVEVLNRLWKQANDRDLGAEHPSVPVVGDRYGEGGRPRLLFVGKAPFGFTIDSGKHPWTLDQMLRQATDCFTELNHPFHRFQDRCVKKVLSAPEGILPRRYGASTNVMKIGAHAKDGGNPIGPLAALQRDDCEAFLDLEFRALDPTGIVFLTNNYEWRLLEKIVLRVEGHGWERHVDLSEALWTATRGPARVYWTYHPQSPRMQSGLATKVIAAIGDDQRAWLERA